MAVNMVETSVQYPEDFALLERGVAKFGSRTALARLLVTSVQNMSRWGRSRPIPDRFRRKLERELESGNSTDNGDAEATEGASLMKRRDDAEQRLRRFFDRTRGQGIEWQVFERILRAFEEQK